MSSSEIVDGSSLFGLLRQTLMSILECLCFSCIMYQILRKMGASMSRVTSKTSAITLNITAYSDRIFGFGDITEFARLCSVIGRAISIDVFSINHRPHIGRHMSAVAHPCDMMVG